MSDGNEGRPVVWELQIGETRRAGEISIGTIRSNARKSLGAVCRPFSRGGDPCDYYPDKYVYLYFDADERIEAIEIAEPAQVKLDMHSLMEMTLREAQDLLMQQDPKAILEADMGISKKYGLSVFSSRGLEGKLECVMVFEDGYYD